LKLPALVKEKKKVKLKKSPKLALKLLELESTNLLTGSLTQVSLNGLSYPISPLPIFLLLAKSKWLSLENLTVKFSLTLTSLAKRSITYALKLLVLCTVLLLSPRVFTKYRKLKVKPLVKLNRQSLKKEMKMSKFQLLKT